MAVSALTGKSVKSINPSAVLEHVVFCKNRPSLDNFSIISSASNNFDLELKESLLILLNLSIFQKVMILRVVTIALLFLIRLRFPGGKSINEVLRDRYGNLKVQLCRKFEKVDYKLRKAKLDLEFLETCSHHGLTPRFLQFKLSNKDLRSSDAYRQCQNRLLNEEIYIKKSTIRTLENQFNVHRNSLRASLSYLDFTHITCLFLARNDRILAANDETQKKKLFNLGLQSVPTKHDPDRVIHNFSSHILSEADKSLLARGLNYAIPPSKVEYADYMVSFEKLYRNVKSMEMSSETRDLLKSRMKDCAISSFESYNSSKKPKNLSDEELEALFSDILNDTAKFAKVKCDKEKELNFIINQEKKVTAVLKTLLHNGSLERRLHEKLKPTGSKLGILYGLCKIHKSIVNGSPPFRPILSAIDTPTYNLAKFLVPLLAPLTVNEYTVFNSFSFAEEISKQDSSLFMASLDVDSLFTNIPLQETIDICTDSLFSETDPVSNFCKSDFRKLLSLATENSYFTFDGQLFKQVDGESLLLNKSNGPTDHNYIGYSKLLLNLSTNPVLPQLWRLMLWGRNRDMPTL
ncbi:uncharacterized protein LOC130629365 [Hydractinia symbiolongicarpus]|uniref:uncharacterized protein LOC130629365 n=1 Tax=Hydractinia symbiolongicarpus TaxID=13093 RepID=UPI00254BCF62|nr:uncharacterized protein LOC130629365 [Hydractinia symbiolongicarpus]